MGNKIFTLTRSPGINPGVYDLWVKDINDHGQTLKERAIGEEHTIDFSQPYQTIFPYYGDIKTLDPNDPEIAKQIAYIFINQFRSRFEYLRIKTYKDSSSLMKYFSFQYIFNEDYQTLYVYYHLANELTSLMEPYVPTFRSILDKDIITNLSFQFRIPIKVIERIDDDKNKYIGSIPNYLPLYCVGVYWNESNNVYEFVQDRQLFNHIMMSNYISCNSGSVNERLELDRLLIDYAKKITELNIDAKRNNAPKNVSIDTPKGVENVIMNNSIILEPDQILELYNSYKSYMEESFSISLPDVFEKHISWIEFEFVDDIETVMMKNEYKFNIRN